MRLVELRLRQADLKFWVGGFEDVCQEICQHLSQPLVILPASLNDLASIWHQPQLAHPYSNIDICTTDGMSLVYWLRLITGRQVQRVYGPELMAYVLAHSDDKSHYLVAANSFVKCQIVSYVIDNFIDVNLIGSSILEKSENEDIKEKQILEKIKKDSPDVLWIGIGSPKQVRLAQKWQRQLPDTTIFCVGAAFALLSGTKPMAPKLIRHIGLEWLYRLLSEPKRLGKRYLWDIPTFIIEYLFTRMRSFLSLNRSE